MIDDYVLYADHDEDDRFFLSLSFEKNVFDKHLEAVSSGNELLKFLENHKDQKGLPCLIILDQKMNGLQGEEVLGILKNDERYRHIPVVMFTTSHHFNNTALLDEYEVGVEIKPDILEDWETIALKLLEHCEAFKNKTNNYS